MTKTQENNRKKRPEMVKNNFEMTPLGGISEKPAYRRSNKARAQMRKCLVFGQFGSIKDL